MHKKREMKVIPRRRVKVCEQRVLFKMLLVHRGRSLLLRKAVCSLANEDFNDRVFRGL